MRIPYKSDIYKGFIILKITLPYLATGLLLQKPVSQNLMHPEHPIPRTECPIPNTEIKKTNEKLHSSLIFYVKFNVSDFDKFDTIYAMDESNYRNIISLARDDQDKAKVKFILNEIYPDQNYNVPDPYYGGHDGFENVYKMLDEACTIIANSLINPSNDNS